MHFMEKFIIERVEGPTTCASPVAVAPKPTEGIRLCVDVRRANEVNVRERLTILTVHEVLEEFNSSTAFSKLDLRWKFHQLELHKDSRDITTFITHEGLFGYKRFILGVNNVADNLIVREKTVLEHDQRLYKLLAKLEEKNLTLNVEKCFFRMNKIGFMRILLPQHGVGFTEEKARAV